MKNLLYGLFFLTISFGKVYSQNPEWINYFAQSDIPAIAVEQDYIWVGGVGLTKINAITGEKTFFYKLNSGLPSNGISSIAIDQNGNKWIGTGANYGLVLLGLFLVFGGSLWV